MLFICILVFFSDSSFAQSKFSDNLKLMLNYHAGVVLPEYQFNRYVTEDYIHSVDVSLIKQTYGEKSIEQIFNYPEYGLSYFYSTLGNDRVMGREMALNAFLKLNLILKDHFHLYNQMGLGLSYVTKKFDFQDNFLDVGVGSYFNLHYNYRLGASYLISKKIELNTGISFDHFSNGNTSEPNLGLNYLTLYGGLAFKLGRQMERKVQLIEPHVRINSIDLFTNVGGKHTRSLSSNYYFTSSISLQMVRKYYRAFYLGMGADLFYDSSVKNEMKSKGEAYHAAYDFQSGIHISQTFAYSRFNLILQEGVYLLLLDKVNRNTIYNRGIFQYQATDRIAVRLAMKSHLHILDYPELGLGFKL